MSVNATAAAAATTTETPSVLSGGASAGAASSGASASSGAASGGGGTTTATPSWRDSLPEDIRGEASLQTFTDVGALAKSYVNAQKMIGAEKIAIPGKFATQDDWNAVYKKLGLPESVDKYELKLPDGVQADEKFMGAFKEQALKAGILPSQAQNLLAWYHQSSADQAKAAQEAQAASVQKGVDDLKKEWGQGFDKNVARAEAAVIEFGGPEFSKHMRASGLGNDPHFIKLMAKIGETLKEESISGEGERPGGKTPAEAQSEINSIYGDRSHPYFSKDHPKHAEAVVHVQKLLEAIHGSA